VHLANKRIACHKSFPHILELGSSWMFTFGNNQEFFSDTMVKIGNIYLYSGFLPIYAPKGNGSFSTHMLDTGHPNEAH